MSKIIIDLEKQGIETCILIDDAGYEHPIICFKLEMATEKEQSAVSRWGSVKQRKELFAKYADDLANRDIIS